jgi:mRNA interferase RelE/StbE
MMAGNSGESHGQGSGEGSGKKDDDNRPFDLEWTEYSRADYDSLDGSQLVFVDKALARIKSLGMQAGSPLAGELVGCRKLKHRKLGLHIVFRQSEKGIQIIQIVAIGACSGLAVYRQSKSRMG